MENKTGKYFKYAIGEIILVVIGILIALQINNWNEDRKNTDQFLQFLTAIKANIEEDITELDSLKIRHIKNIEYCKKERDLFLKKEFDFRTFYNATSDAFATYYFKPNRSAFNALSNSTVMGKLNGTDLNNYFIDYYDQVSLIYQEEKSINDLIESINAMTASEFDSTLIMARFLLTDSELDSLNVSLESVMQKAQQVQKSFGYRKVINEAVVQEYILLPEYEKLDKIGKQVISAINDEI